MRTRHKISFLTYGVLLLLLFALLVVAGGSAEAQGQGFSVPIDTVREGPVGTEVDLGVDTVVQEDLIGVPCAVTSNSQNQQSVHPNNDLLVRSGDGVVTLADVESASDAVVVGTPNVITLGSTVTVGLRFGEHEIFSGGMSVDFDCSPVSTTTVPDEPTTTTIPVEECFDEGGNPFTYNDPYDGDCGEVTTTLPPTTPTTAPVCGPGMLACSGSSQQTPAVLLGGFLLILGASALWIGSDWNPWNRSN